MRGAAWRAGLLLAAVMLSRPGDAACEETPIRTNGVDYACFDAFCARNELGGLTKLSGAMPSTHPQAVPLFSAVDSAGGEGALAHGDYFRVSGPAGSLVFQVDKLQFFFNGTRHWLSFPLCRAAGIGLVISKIDESALLEVLLKGRRAVEGRKFGGVMIDAGHGGYNRGATGRNGTTEKAATLGTALELKRILEAGGVRVAMTRTGDRFVSLDGRSSIANNDTNRLFVSIHYNVGRSTSHGVETYALTPQGAASTGSEGKASSRDKRRYPGNDHDRESLLLADGVQRELCKHHSPAGDRGVKWARFEVLRDTEMPAILVEAGFLSHPVDADLIAGESYRNQVAAAIACGLTNFIATMAAEPGAPSPTRIAGAAPLPQRAAIPDPQPHDPPSAEAPNRTPPSAAGRAAEPRADRGIP